MSVVPFPVVRLDDESWSEQYCECDFVRQTWMCTAACRVSWFTHWRRPRCTVMLYVNRLRKLRQLSWLLRTRCLAKCRKGQYCCWHCACIAGTFVPVIVRHQTKSDAFSSASLYNTCPLHCQQVPVSYLPKCVAGEVRVLLVHSNGYLPHGLLNITCRLTDCTIYRAACLVSLEESDAVGFPWICCLQ